MVSATIKTKGTLVGSPHSPIGADLNKIARFKQYTLKLEPQKSSLCLRHVVDTFTIRHTANRIQSNKQFTVKT